MTKVSTDKGRIRKGWVMKGNRTKKIAPIDMRKEEIQHVIDGYLVQEVLKQIPPEIKILGGIIKISLINKKKRMIVPNILKQCGVQSIWVGDGAKDVVITFDEISRNALIKNVKLACSRLNMPFERAYFSSLLLSNGQGNGRFEHCTKEQTPDETDLRKKLRVLGLVSGKDRVQSLIADIHAKKFRCMIKEEPAKFIMCERA